VRTSAPGGSDWNCNDCVGGGFGFDQSVVEIDEHPASATPIMAAVVVVANLVRDMDRLRAGERGASHPPGARLSRCFGKLGKRPEAAS
jgi:hypothetical protein